MAEERETRWKHCAEPECPEKVKDHYWGHVKAEGWFFSMETGDAFCPAHNPPWVAEWRERKKAKKQAGCPHFVIRKTFQADGYECRIEMDVKVSEVSSSYDKARNTVT